MAPHLRLARPVTDLARAEAQYTGGLGLHVIGRFEDHDGFDGVMLGFDDAPWHLEFTVCRRHPVAPAPTAEDLLVLWLPDPDEWRRGCDALLAAGFTPVAPFNPWWGGRGRSFADADGYRLVLQNAAWERPAWPRPPEAAEPTGSAHAPQADASGPTVDFDELENALYWASAADFEHHAFVSLATGEVVLCGEGVDGPPAEHFDDPAYVAVPTRHELDLGRRLVQRFSDEHLPQPLADRVDACFRRRGAYGRFKDLLDAHGHLQAWYDFEQAETDAALRAWCESEGLNLAPRPQRPAR